MSCGLDVEPEVAFCEGQKQKENMKKLQITIFAISLAAAMSVSASITISGSDLSNLIYRPNGGVAQYVAGTPDVAQLSTPDSGLTGGAPAVFVKAANAGLPSLGTLNSFSASYDLLSSSGPSGTQPYWLTYLYAPGGGYIGVISMGGPDLNGSSQIHVIYNFDTDPNPHSTGDYWGDTLSTLDSALYNGTTTFGQMTVYETAVEIGDWANGNAVIPASANIDSITLFPVPEPTTMIAGALLLLPFGASTLRMLRKNRTA
jgi:hypothetical protein